MVKQDKVCLACRLLLNQNVARMWVTVYKPLNENHVTIQMAKLVRHLKRINFVSSDILEIIHLASIQVLHSQNPSRA